MYHAGACALGSFHRPIAAVRAAAGRRAYTAPPPRQRRAAPRGAACPRRCPGRPPAGASERAARPGRRREASAHQAASSAAAARAGLAACLRRVHGQQRGVDAHAACGPDGTATRQRRASPFAKARAQVLRSARLAALSSHAPAEERERRGAALQRGPGAQRALAQLCARRLQTPDGASARRDEHTTLPARTRLLSRGYLRSGRQRGGPARARSRLRHALSPC